MKDLSKSNARIWDMRQSDSIQWFTNGDNDSLYDDCRFNDDNDVYRFYGKETCVQNVFESVLVNICFGLDIHKDHE